MIGHKSWAILDRHVTPVGDKAFSALDFADAGKRVNSRHHNTREGHFGR